MVNGAGQIEVVTRDLLGRETTVTQDFYASDQLLLPGLNDYALNAGFLRKNYIAPRYSRESDCRRPSRIDG